MKSISEKPEDDENSIDDAVPAMSQQINHLLTDDTKEYEQFFSDSDTS